MPRRGFDEVVLLTGFPTFAARKMCEELLRGPERTLVHAIVPPKFAAEASAALDALPLEQRQRVNVLEGDAAAMDFGLSGKELSAITPEVDRIHHMAQVTYLGADEALATRVNVNGAKEAIEVATLCSALRCLVHHSSASVSGDRVGLVLEDELDEGQSWRSEVEETIARGERYVRAHRMKLPIAILRPTIVVGDSRTGEVDRLDGPYFLVLLLLTSPPDLALPLPGRGEAALNLVPIDYVVRAARAIGRDPRAPGRTFHVGDPSPVTVRRVFDLVAAAAGRRGPRGFIPANITKALLRTPGLDRFLKSPRALLETLATPVIYSVRGTTELLADTSIRCPPLESYIERLVDYVQLRLRERREQAEREVRDPLG